MKTATTLAIAILAGLASAQNSTDPVAINPDTSQVSIASKGLDVRDVLFDLFSQSGNNFVLEPNVRFVLYLSLAGVQFEEALAIVLDISELDFELQNGIYFISKSSGTGEQHQAVPQAIALQGRVPEADLDKKLTVKSKMMEIRALFEEFEKQTGVLIEVDPAVPAYKLDAFLVDTTLRHALEVVTTAAGLEYTKTDMRSIRITKAD